MNKTEVLARLCQLVRTVAERRFDANAVPHDCFCRKHTNPQVHPDVIEYIERAVNGALEDGRI